MLIDSSVPAQSAEPQSGLSVPLSQVFIFRSFTLRSNLQPLQQLAKGHPNDTL